MNIGDRVGAFLGSTEEGVQFLGYGVYEGDFVPVGAVGFLSEMLLELNDISPRIRLDSGKIVYGCECFWGSAKSVDERLKGHNIVMVDIEAVREELRAENSAS